MGNKLFGTDGVRGVANVYPMTADFAMKLALACAETVCKNKKQIPAPVFFQQEKQLSDPRLLAFAPHISSLTAVSFSYSCLYQLHRSKSSPCLPRSRIFPSFNTRI